MLMRGRGGSVLRILFKFVHYKYMGIKTKRKKRLRKKPRVRLLFLILLGSGVIAYGTTRFVGCAE